MSESATQAKDAGAEYAEIWGETLHTNRHLRVISVDLIRVGFDWNAREADVVVDDEDSLFLVGEAHGLLADPEMFRSRFPGLRKLHLQRVFRTGLVTEMKFRKRLPGNRKGLKICRNRNAWQFIHQIVGEALPVAGCLQDAVDVIKNIVLGDRVVVVAHAEGAQGDV